MLVDEEGVNRVIRRMPLGEPLSLECSEKRRVIFVTKGAFSGTAWEDQGGVHLSGIVGYLGKRTRFQLYSRV